jgi:PEP-CTERM motif
MKPNAFTILQSTVSVALLGFCISGHAQTLSSTAPLTNYAPSPLGAGPLQLSLEPSSYTFTFSNGGYTAGQPVRSVAGAVGILNDGGFSVLREGEAKVTESTAPIPRSNESFRFGSSFTGPLGAVQINPANSQVDVIALQGGVSLNSSYKTEAQSTVNESLSITNMRANLRTGMVTADLRFTSVDSQTGTEPYAGASYSQSGVELWQASVLSLPVALKPSSLNALHQGNATPINNDGFNVTAIERTEITPGSVTYVNGNPIYGYQNIPGYPYGYGPAYLIGYEQVPVYTAGIDAVNAHLTSTITLTDLRLTEQGAGYLSGSFSGDTASVAWYGIDTLNSQAGGWGSITATLNISAAVPEPSTYGLMGLGLVGMSMVCRQRQRALAASATA